MLLVYLASTPAQLLLLRMMMMIMMMKQVQHHLHHQLIMMTMVMMVLVHAWQASVRGDEASEESSRRARSQECECEVRS